MKHPVAYILLASMICPTCFGQPTRSKQISTYVVVTEFDAKRDAAADINAAIAEAQRTQKRIILYVGGPWCPYCDQLEQMFRKNPDLQNLRDTHFITVPIYLGSDKNNARALAPYTPILGIPHFYVLESNGSLLRSQHLLELRANGEYSPSKMREFLTLWANSDNIAVSK